MSTTPSSQLRLQLLQLLLLPVIILLVILAAAAEERLPMGLPDCPDMCGNISIPFPFGIGYGCFRDGFEVLCNHTPEGHRAFLADKRIVKRTGEGYESESANPSAPPSKDLQWSQSPLELVSISLATGEVRAYAAIAYRCRRDDNRTFCVEQDLMFARTLFDLSIKGTNILIGVGWSVEPLLDSNTGSADHLSCKAQDMFPPAVNGSCEGYGCCDMPFPPGEYRPGKAFGWLVARENLMPHSYDLETKPCSYAMLVEKSWYNFSTPDLYGNMTLLKKNPRGVTLVLDFAAGNTSCPAEGQPRPPGYACVSGNSSCVNATVAPGYICRCWDHYAGNSYITHGCQDIDECKLPDICANGGVCKNKPGGYDCPCRMGMKNGGERGN
ncbi:hypothetical protein VPH35_011049 [Triticum aestivum]